MQKPMGQDLAEAQPHPRVLRRAAADGGGQLPAALQPGDAGAARAARRAARSARSSTSTSAS